MLTSSHAIHGIFALPIYNNKIIMMGLDRFPHKDYVLILTPFVACNELQVSTYGPYSLRSYDPDRIMMGLDRFELSTTRFLRVYQSSILTRLNYRPE